MRTIAVANAKGGVGKTATAHALGEILAGRGLRTLLVDADPQATLSAACGVTDAAGRSLAEVLGGAEPGDLAIRDVVREIGPEAVWTMLRRYARVLGLDIAPHDLRRTYAKLAHKGGAPLEQIQLSLGHASIQTTERYLGLEQSFTDAPCDRLGLRVEV